MTLDAKIRGSLLSFSHGVTLGTARRGLRKAARIVTRRPLVVRFFHRVDDPESLLMAEGLALLRARHGFEIEVIVVPEPSADVDPEPELALGLARREAARVARLYGLPALPAHIEPPPAARVRLVQATLLETSAGEDALDRVLEAGRALFAGDGDAVASLVRRYGAVAGPDLRPRLEANHRALLAAGHYAGATATLDGETFHRVDRLALLEARLAPGEGAPVFAVSEPPLAPPGEGAAPAEVKMYASFQCPFSYLGLTRLLRIAQERALEIEVRPVRPLVMRGLRTPAVKRRDILTDAAREAARLGIRFGPFIEPRDAGVQRALHLWYEAKREGRDLELMESMLRGVWCEAADLERDADLIRLAARAGLDEATVEQALINRDGLAAAEANREARRELGLWGVPSFQVGEISTWGQDRIPLLFG